MFLYPLLPFILLGTVATHVTSRTQSTKTALSGPALAVVLQPAFSYLSTIMKRHLCFASFIRMFFTNEPVSATAATVRPILPPAVAAGTAATADTPLHYQPVRY